MALMLIALLLALLLGPQLWVRRVLATYREPAERYASCGTGADFARHLLARHDLGTVTVETTALGDHYDPGARSVRLLPLHHDGRSLAAVTIAAHEVGHALQHAEGSVLFAWRQRLASLAMGAERASALLLLVAPVLVLLTRAPQVGLLCVILAVTAALLGTLVHLVTLPVEWDASFARALPLLEQGGHLYPSDLPHARRILRAAALTYVASSAASLLNVWRWLAILRR